MDTWIHEYMRVSSQRECVAINRAVSWKLRKVELYCDTSAVRPLVPAVGAVRNAVAQFAHVNAEFGPSTLVLVGRAARHGTVGT